MKIGLLKRNLITVYSLVVVLACLLVGCLRQPGEVISQSDKSSKDTLIASQSSSSFNYFESKKEKSSTQADAHSKVDESSPNIQKVGYEEEKPGRVNILGDSVARFENSVVDESKKLGKTAEKRPESWRSKSLIEAAKRYPSKVAKTYQSKSNRIKDASNSVVQGISNGIQQIAKTVSSSEEQSKTENKRSDAESSTADQFRTDELSRYYDQATHQDAHSQISQLGKDLKRDLEQTKPAFEDVDHEMRRLQINTIMERAKKESERKNYEYALFLAEQALESSFRGHVAFGPEEESPQKLLQHIKSIVPVRQDSEVKPIEHIKSKVKTNGGQSVQNFQFSPSAVHPLRKRPAAKPKKVRAQSGSLTDPKQELPLITPRNMGIEQQRNVVSPDRSVSQEPKKSNSSQGVLLETPSFEQQSVEQNELPVSEKTQTQKPDSVPHPALKPNLEEFPDEPPVKIRISGPEPDQKKTETEAKKSTSPGPKLMLPNLPSAPQDLTFQTGKDQTHQNTFLNQSGQNQQTQTAPVKFRSKIQETVKDKQTFLVEEKPAGETENRHGIESALTLDEIQWDLEEKRRPQPKSSWWSMSSVLLLISGVVILLLLTIIIVLLRRRNSTT